MTVLYTTLLVLTAVCSAYTHTTLELSGVVKCSTGRSAFAYIMYGCYCGVGGEGWPRDPADWCCHKHDCCYAEAEDQSCHTKTHTSPWSCDSHSVDCGALTDSCEKMLCVCNQEAAQCLKKAAYNFKYVAWPDFLCGAELPTCAYY